MRKNPNEKPGVAHFNRLALYAALRQHLELTFKEFVNSFGTGHKFRHLFTVPEEYSLAHCAAVDMSTEALVHSERNSIEYQNIVR